MQLSISHSMKLHREVLTKRWIYDNSDLFVGKRVLELGAGCGLSGIIAAMFADVVVLSDYLPQVRNVILIVTCRLINF